MSALLDLDVRWRRGELDLQVATAVPLTGTTAIFGPSGSGKTSLMRLIAGLETPDEGTIRAGNTVWFDGANQVLVPTAQRGAGLVFQDTRLFPHMSVKRNLDYADRRRDTGVPRAARADIEAAFDVGPLLARRTAALSGGERQRVALARALLSAPKLLMLDEPLSALDAERKARILPYLKRAATEFAVPIIYVTHSVEEVLQLADRVVMLRSGKVEAEGLPTDLLGVDDAQSDTLNVEAILIGPGTLSGTIRVAVNGQELEIDGEQTVPIGAPIRIAMRVTGGRLLPR